MGGKFLTTLRIEQVSANKWRLTHELVYSANAGVVWLVPAGFVTDMASIPRAMWSVIGHPADKYAPAAVLHDWLYTSHLVSRAQADELFREAMAVLGVGRVRRSVMWAAVRVFGGRRWGKTSGK